VTRTFLQLIFFNLEFKTTNCKLIR